MGHSDIRYQRAKAHFEEANGVTLLRSNRVVATGRVRALAFGELLL